MSISQILLVLAARWRSALAVLAVVLAAAAALTAWQPRIYVATASVLLDVKSSDPIAGAAMQALAISGYMATQADVIVSQRVISHALRLLKLDTDPANLAAWRSATGGRGDLLDWLSERAARNIEVRPSRESNVITLSSSSTDPEAAAAMVNALVEAYVATTIELRAEPAKQYNSFFDERTKKLRLALEQAQDQLSQFQRDAGVVANDERLDIETSRLAELSTQLTIAQAAATEAGSRRRLGAADPTATQEALANPLIASLGGELARQRARLSELQTRLGERNPEVETARATVAELQARVQAETAKVQSGLAMASDVHAQKASHLQAAVDQQRGRVLRLKAQRDRAAVLQRDVDNANQAYSAAYARLGQSNMESQATQTNVSLLRVAAVPTAPAKPRAIVNMGVALVIGVLASTALAVVREMRDQRLRSNEDVALLLQQPLLGALPHDGRRSPQRPFWWRRMLSRSRSRSRSGPAPGEFGALRSQP